MWIKPLYVFLALGLSGAIAFPKPESDGLAIREGPDPSTCPMIKCTSTTYPYYNPKTKSCSCLPIDDNPDPSTCPTIRCNDSTYPFYNPETKKCSCIPNEVTPDPSTCPTIRCAEKYHPVWIPEEKHCECKADNKEDPNPSCPLMKCLANHHVAYHPETETCACDPDCPDTFCISEMTGVLDLTTNKCNCQWLPGLEPSTTGVIARAFPLPTAGLGNPCKNMLCIPEMHIVYNATTKTCDCVWIDGFGPISS